MQRSGGGAVSREINVNSRRPLIPTVGTASMPPNVVINFEFTDGKSRGWSNRVD